MERASSPLLTLVQDLSFSTDFRFEAGVSTPDVLRRSASLQMSPGIYTYLLHKRQCAV